MKLVLSFLLCALAYGTTFYQRPFEEVVQGAPVIVRGIVGNQYADWGNSRDGTRRIYTFFELQISEVIKGGVAGRTLLFREMGGQKDGLGLQIAGSARFEQNEDVVVFLNEQNADRSFDLRGMVMGKFNIQKTSDGEELLLGAAIAGDEHVHQIARQDLDEHGHEGHRDTVKKWTLDALRILVKKDVPKKQEEKPVVTHSALAPASARQEAPQLQSGSVGEASKQPSLLWGGLGVLVFLSLFVFGLIFWLQQRRRG